MNREYVLYGRQLIQICLHQFFFMIILNLSLQNLQRIEAHHQKPSERQYSVSTHTSEGRPPTDLEEGIPQRLCTKYRGETGKGPLPWDDGRWEVRQCPGGVLT